MTDITEFQGEFRWLSNFAPAPVLMYGVEYPSVEHAYQAAKCAVAADRKMFLNITAGQAKRLGREVRVRPDWDEFKVEAMTMLVRRKFEIPEYRARLLGTGDVLIAEGNQWGDTFWGVCNGRGDNVLGKILMVIREEIKCQS